MDSWAVSDCSLGTVVLLSGLEQPTAFPQDIESWLESHPLTPCPVTEDILSSWPWHPLKSHFLFSSGSIWFNQALVIFISLALAKMSLQHPLLHSNYFYIQKIETLDTSAGSPSARSSAQSLPRLLQSCHCIWVPLWIVKTAFPKLNSQKFQTSLSEFTKFSKDISFPFLALSYLNINGKNLQWQRGGNCVQNDFPHLPYFTPTLFWK